MELSKEKRYIVNGRSGQYELSTADGKSHCFFMDDTDDYEYFPINSRIEEVVINKKKNQMKLYLISQDVNNGYETYDSAVVVADSEETARSTHPGRKDWNGKSSAGWCDKESVSVRLIGTAAKGVDGVICVSYNAG